ncbi:hypothetical protein F0562_032240 [Nyssa sinensis]|uniref:Uncharacterized protein n=1 Tax=Nyssa sinensis TaxID=561372 RepID=A0A5J5APN6_9ASTE|nr:hypothetical protein F0562_032240 [Nyssa sinensis]
MAQRRSSRLHYLLTLLDMGSTRFCGRRLVTELDVETEVSAAELVSRVEMEQVSAYGGAEDGYMYIGVRVSSSVERDKMNVPEMGEGLDLRPELVSSLLQFCIQPLHGASQNGI